MDRRWDTGHQTKLKMGTGHGLQPHDLAEGLCLQRETSVIALQESSVSVPCLI